MEKIKNISCSTEKCPQCNGTGKCEQHIIVPHEYTTIEFIGKCCMCNGDKVIDSILYQQVMSPPTNKPSEIGDIPF